VIVEVVSIGETGRGVHRRFGTSAALVFVRIDDS
jgi:hypothetical protein